MTDRAPVCGVLVGMLIGALISIAPCLLAGCSALGLGEYDALPCNVAGEVSPCEALNAELPAGQCERYRCHVSGRGCELLPRDEDQDEHADARVCSGMPGLGDLDCDDAPETGKQRHFGLAERCDGIDNDCDGFIDEGTTPEAMGATIALGQSVEQISHVALDSAGDGGALLAITQRDSRGQSFVSEALTLDDAEPLEARTLLPAATPCPGTDPPEFCNFAQLALAAAPPRLIAAGIHRGQCHRGQLRVGLGTLQPLALSLADADARSNVSAGVDVDPSNCTVSSGCAGASEPVLAALPALNAGDDAQALAVWLAPADQGCAEPTCTACATAAPSVPMGIGLFVEERAEGGPALVGSDGGHAEPLGMGALGPPALVAFASPDPSQAGYVLAYAAAEHVELLFVPRLDVRMPLASRARRGRIEQLSVSAVTLAVRRDQIGNPNAVVLVSVGKEGGVNSINFVVLSLTRGEAPHIASGQRALSLPADGPVIGAPVLVHANEGFAMADEASSGTEGGWLVLWIEAAPPGRTRLMSARIADRQQRRLGAPVELASGEISLPFVDLSHDQDETPGLRFGYVDQQELRLKPMTCARE